MTGSSSPESVSCIVPVYNGVPYLTEALESIFRQTHPPAEVIVVNDGSIDGTGEVLRKWSDRVRRLDQPRSGPAAARNAGIRAARFPILAFLDADDLWTAEKLESQVGTLAEQPELGFTLSFIENFWAPELGEVPASVRDHPASGARPGYYFQTMAARRWVFDQVGLLDESLRRAEDIDWFVRAAEARIPYRIVKQTLVQRRIHGGNSTYLGGGEPDRFLDILTRSVARRRNREAGRPAGLSP